MGPYCPAIFQRMCESKSHSDAPAQVEQTVVSPILQERPTQEPQGHAQIGSRAGPVQDQDKILLVLLDPRTGPEAQI